MLISPQPDQEANKLQRPNSQLLQATPKKFRSLSVQPGLRGSSDLRVGRKMATLQLFFQSGRAKELSVSLYKIVGHCATFSLHVHIAFLLFFWLCHLNSLQKSGIRFVWTSRNKINQIISSVFIKLRSPK